MIRSLLAVVAGLLVIGVGLALNQQLACSNGKLVTGTVSGVKTADYKGRPVYTGLVTFTTQDGREVTIEEPSTSRSRPKLGTTVKVSYQPATPEAGRVIPAYNWISILSYAVGGLIILVGLGSLFVRRSGAPGSTKFRAARG